MAKSYKRTLLTVLFALVPLFAGCDSARDISGVTEPVTPTVAAKPKLAKVLTRVINGTTGIAVSDYVTNGKTALLQVGKYQLFVPRGAVKKPTKFVMVVLDNEMIGVRLYAFDKDWQRVTQFHVPVRLTLPYDEADQTQVSGTGKLRIANVVSDTDNTILELVGVEVDTDNQTVTGSLSHFSVWSLAKELSMGID
ncbi:MAG TPA: hypothetical protein VFO52_03565 [Longimicrobiales bacterium]|nr:hypothetical protein [Longimicrobiales bacterium]